MVRPKRVALDSGVAGGWALQRRTCSAPGFTMLVGVPRM